jgi:uncharacterized protein with HEPN domain
VTAEREERALAYIRDCIALIERDIRTDPQALSDRQRASARAILWSLYTLADASGKLSEEPKERHPEVVWPKLRGFRNFSAHAYERLQLQVVSAIVEDDLPLLKAAVETELKALRRER